MSGMKSHEPTWGWFLKENSDGKYVSSGLENSVPSTPLVSPRARVLHEEQVVDQAIESLQPKEEQGMLVADEFCIVSCLKRTQNYMRLEDLVKPSTLTTAFNVTLKKAKTIACLAEAYQEKELIEHRQGLFRSSSLVLVNG